MSGGSAAPDPPFSVLHVSQPPDSGVPRVAGNLVADQVERGWDVTVASPRGSELRQLALDAGARYVPWEATRSPGPTVPGEVARLARLVGAADPQLVHLHSAKAGLAGRLAIRGRRPTLFQPHAWSFEAVRGALRKAAVSWERAGARWADAVVCVSGGERERGEAVGVRARFAEIPNGIDLSLYRPASADDRATARAALGLAPGVPLAVVVGRLSPQKGQGWLLRAWPEVLRSVPDAELVLVGHGPDEARLREAQVPNVHFAGQQLDVASWFAAATVTVVPSRWEAGLSLVAMEAMASARGVVASDIPGMREGVGPGCGAVVPLHAGDRLAAAIAERLGDPQLADREGAAARRWVEDRYDLVRTSDRMARLYGDVIARRAA
jgi:glycosyltransferase involved in cell wall biosynthesis